MGKLSNFMVVSKNDDFYFFLQNETLKLVNAWLYREMTVRLKNMVIMEFNGTFLSSIYWKGGE